MKLGISVVIPAYNEQDNVKKSIKNVHDVLKNTNWDWEIIVVNDGSSDKTGEFAKSEISRLKIKSARVLEHYPNRGYGGALKRGFYDAKKEFVTFAHSDNQFDFSEIHKLVKLQESTNADIVSGIRPMGGKDEPIRIFFRWGWNTLVRALFGYLASDIDCGFKLFRRNILERISLPSDGAMIDTQLYAGARVRGMKIVETPVTHLPRVAGQSTGGNPKVIFKALKELAVFWWQLRQEILVEEGRAIFRWEAISIVLIALLGSFLRLYRIDGYMTFLGDEGRDAVVMREIVLGKHFPAIGPGTSIGNMYLGPLYYYLTAPFLALFNFSPVGPAVEVALIGVATMFLMWWIGRQWFGRTPSLFISLLYATSPTVIVYSHSSWNPNVMPLFALVSVYGIWKVWRLGYWRWLVICGISFAFVLNSHYLGLLLLPLLGVFWTAGVVKYKHKTSAIVRSTVVAAVAFSLLMSPLLIYDLRHNGQNFAALKTFFTQRQTTVNLKAYKALPNLWPIFVDVNTSLLAGKNKVVGEKISLFLVLTSLMVFLSRRSPDLKLTLTWILLGAMGLGLYKQHIYDHYFGFIFPAPFLLVGFTVQYLFEKKLLRYVGLLFLFLLGFTHIQNSPLRFAPNNQLSRTEEVAAVIQAKSQDQPFNMALIAKSNYDASYRYFLIHKNTRYLPIRNPYTGELQLTNQLFVICEASDCQPIGHPLAEIASFGWAKIDDVWEFPWGVKVYRLVPNPSGK